MPIDSPVPRRLFALWRDSRESTPGMAAATEARVRDVRTGDREDAVRPRGNA
jgi:hypothetical protein